MSTGQGDICFSCCKSLSSDDDIVCCVECNYGYHLGDCSGLRTRRPGWKCPTCKAKANRSHTPGAAITHVPTDTNIGEKLNEISQMLHTLLPLKDKVDELLAMKETIQNMEVSVQVMSEKYDEVLKQLDGQNKEIKDLKRRIDSMNKLHASVEEMSAVREQLNNLEQYSRRNIVEIHGLPYDAKENLMDKLRDVAEALELPAPCNNDLEVVHRLPAKLGNVPVVLAKFTSRRTRDTWLQKKRLLRTKRVLDHEVYIDENLSESNRKLFYDARVRARNLGYRFVWHKYGITYVRKEEGCSTVRISRVADLERIV